MSPARIQALADAAPEAEKYATLNPVSCRFLFWI
jgi:hypothetical protein